METTKEAGTIRTHGITTKGVGVAARVAVTGVAVTDEGGGAIRILAVTINRATAGALLEIINNTAITEPSLIA